MERTVRAAFRWLERRLDAMEGAAGALGGRGRGGKKTRKSAAAAEVGSSRASKAKGRDGLDRPPGAHTKREWDAAKASEGERRDH